MYKRQAASDAAAPRHAPLTDAPTPRASGFPRISEPETLDAAAALLAAGVATMDGVDGGAQAPASLPTSDGDGVCATQQQQQLAQQQQQQLAQQQMRAPYGQQQVHAPPLGYVFAGCYSYAQQPPGLGPQPQPQPQCIGAPQPGGGYAYGGLHAHLAQQQMAGAQLVRARARAGIRA